MVETGITSLQTAVKDPYGRHAWCNGTWSFSPQDLKLFFEHDNRASSMLFPSATEEQLNELANACHPAKFGTGDVDVLEETYRKAVKMDVSNFSLNMNPERSGLVEAVKLQLLGLDDQRDIRLEPYKLNVYGKGSFFKIHKDTPRGDKMFASLVIVLPTLHNGGALMLSHQDETTIFDSGKMLQSNSPGVVAYVAFFSDVDHEVQEVTFGHRVTITYNLYFKTTESATTPPNGGSEDSRETRFKAVLKSLLADTKFLPKGGLLGFGLKYQYPLSREGEPDLDKMCDVLKGSDAFILRTCDALDLSTSLKIVYTVDEEHTYEVLCDSPWNEGQQFDRDGGRELLDTLTGNYGGMVIWTDDTRYETDAEITWVSSSTSNSAHRASYVAYGNEASIDYIYGDISLIVDVGVPGSRDSP
ncbi:hypothetical protein BD410DRAFT_743915 [Rickenella mellea]|uniref:Prolyl 4-hydroxylase alpha subunit Fe(2+) 2OG dioxygenase domain-containing protein n=1 Tax=Rickenella mellea TaxID=50990 RepID=A0A4Y7QE76_9AGAM|nr:hypothetical protein BD410DRAFT_743915 [Rickenella mellea]